MAVSKQKASGKLGKKASGSAKTTVSSAVSAADPTKSAAKSASPVSPVPQSKTVASPKRVVMTSSEIEAAAKHMNSGVRDDVKKLDPKAQGSVNASAADVLPVSAKAEVAKPEMGEPTATKVTKEPALTSSASSSASAKTASLQSVEKPEAPKAKNAPIAEAKAGQRAMAKGGASPARTQKKAASAKTASKKSTASAAATVAKQQPDAKSAIAHSAVVNATAAAKSPESSPETEKASTVSTKSKTAATPKTAAPTTPKTTTAAKKAADVSATPSPKPVKAAAKPAAKVAAKPAVKPATKTAAPKVVKSADPAPAASPASAPSAASVPTSAVVAKADGKTAGSKPGDIFGFGAMFMDPSAMESYLQIWKTPEVDAMVTASSDAIEESVEVANEALTKLFETMTGQSDVFSGAGSRVAAQCEELLDTQQKSFEEVWQTSMTLFEKTGGIGTELATWMQGEIEATQADMDALTKVESLSDMQELQAKILKRCYESSVSEGEKVQEIMMSVIADSFNALSQATNAAMK